MTTRRRAAFALLAGFGLAAALSAVGSAQAPRAARPSLDGYWVSRNKTIAEGIATGLPLTLGSTPWAPASAGRPEAVKIDSFEVQKAFWEKQIAANVDVFAYFAAHAPKVPYTPEGEKALAAMRANRAAAGKGTPYDRCLPHNIVGAFGSSGGEGFGGVLEVFTARDHIGVLTEQGDYHAVRLGRVDADQFAPTYQGTSVGHWEGDRLVVVTSNFLGDSLNGWPISPKARVVDTVWLTNGGKTLNIRSEMADPVNFKEPMVRMVYLDRGKPGAQFLPTNCVEEVQGAETHAELFGTTPPQ